MADFTSLGKLYADIFVTYAPLSFGYFILSHSEPCSFNGDIWKRTAFGLIAGVAALGSPASLSYRRVLTEPLPT